MKAFFLAIGITLLLLLLSAGIDEYLKWEYSRPTYPYHVHDQVTVSVVEREPNYWPPIHDTVYNYSGSWWLDGDTIKSDYDSVWYVITRRIRLIE